MRTRALLSAAALTLVIGISSTAQFFDIIGRQAENATYTNLAVLRASSKPTTLWAKFVVTNRTYDWKNFRIGVVIATKKLANPVNIPGIGAIEVDLGHILFADLAMKTTHIKSWTDSNQRPAHGVHGSAVLPPIPASFVGRELFVQFIAYQTTVNPLYLLSNVYDQPRDFPFTILPALP